jgi:hypothetical protein
MDIEDLCEVAISIAAICGYLDVRVSSGSVALGAASVRDPW